MRYFLLIVGFVFVLSVNGWAHDDWDLATSSDDTAAGTINTLWHTAPPQIHDLQSPGSGQIDVDWFRIFPRIHRSYEVQVLNVTGDSQTWGNYGEQVSRWDAAGATMYQSSDNLDIGGNHLNTLRWISTANTEQRIWVNNQNTSSTAYSKYTIQLFDTTLFCPRFNNAGSQVSVLIAQAAFPDGAFPFGGCNCTAYFYNEAGTLLTSSTWILNDANMNVIALSSLGPLTGQKGSARIAHDCGWGGIAAKLVALEPSTGFSFDTLCTYLPR